MRTIRVRTTGDAILAFPTESLKLVSWGYSDCTIYWIGVRLLIIQRLDGLRGATSVR